MSPGPTAPVAYYWGDDAYSVERAPERLAARLTQDGAPPERWLVDVARTSASQIAERLSTAPMFGGGTLVVVEEPAPLVASRPLASALVATFEAIAPGNALAFLHVVDGSGRPLATLEGLRKAVEAAGGDVQEFRAPTQESMARWIQERAAERSIRIATAAARTLAERVGAFVREGDVNRAQQGAIAVAELEKLAVYRLDGEIRPDDVAALVPDVVPASMFAFIDAVGARHGGRAADLAEKLVETVPGPVLVVRLHRRLRELIEVGELLASGAEPGSLVRTLKLNPYVAKKLVEQSRAWTLPELDAAMGGLLELDGALKGGAETRQHAAIALWLAERVQRGGLRAGA